MFFVSVASKGLRIYVSGLESTLAGISISVDSKGTCVARKLCKCDPFAVFFVSVHSKGVGPHANSANSGKGADGATLGWERVQKCAARATPK